MKRLFVAFLGLAALTGAAAAADLGIRPAPYYKGPPPMMIPPYTWTGFYLGVNGGGGWGHSNWDTAGGISTSGGLVGGTVGYNFQYDRAVFGARRPHVKNSRVKASAAAESVLGARRVVLILKRIFLFYYFPSIFLVYLFSILGYFFISFFLVCEHYIRLK